LGDILIEVYAAHPILQDPLQVVPLSFLVCSQLDLFDVHALLQVQDDLILLYCSPQTGLIGLTFETQPRMLSLRADLHFLRSSLLHFFGSEWISDDLVVTFSC
jgi:hypothetical protein